MTARRAVAVVVQAQPGLVPGAVLLGTQDRVLVSIDLGPGPLDCAQGALGSPAQGIGVDELGPGDQGALDGCALCLGQRCRLSRGRHGDHARMLRRYLAGCERLACGREVIVESGRQPDVRRGLGGPGLGLSAEPGPGVGHARLGGDLRPVRRRHQSQPDRVEAGHHTLHLNQRSGGAG